MAARLILSIFVAISEFLNFITLQHRAMTTQIQTKARKNWIDWMKAIGMLVIIWGHSFPTGLTSFIYSFNVPLFFIISGYLFKKETSMGTFFKKNLYSLIIPYLILCVIKDFSHIAKYWNNFQELINCPIGILTGFHTFNGAPGAKNLWFVYTLFLLKIIFQITGNKRINMIALLTTSIAGALAMHLCNISIDWAVTNVFLALPWFMLGYVASSNYNAPLDRAINYLKEKKSITIGGFAILTTLLLFVAKHNGEVRMFRGFCGDNLILFFIFGLIGSLAIFLLSVSLDKIQAKAVQIISIGTMVILQLHIDIYYPLGKIVKNLSEGVVSEGLLSLTASAITLLIFIPIIMILQKIFPLVLGKRKI